MNKSKYFAGKTVVVVGFSMLLGVSAFAETRHRNETRMRDTGGSATSARSVRGTTSRGDGATRREQHVDRGDRSRSDRGTTVQPERGQVRRERDNNDRGTRRETRTRENTDRGNQNRTWDRSNDRGTRNDTRTRNDNNRGNRNDNWNRNNNNRGNRNDSWDRNNNRGRNNGGWQPSRDRHGRQPYYGQGNVSRCVRYGNGYHIWIGGSRYPFFVPLAYYNSHRIRVGVALNLWGYYNSLGYYDYYDAGYSSYNAVRSEFRGVVEEVDYRRDRLVVRNEDSGNFVTVNLGTRRFENVRPGDFVVIEGDWTRSNVFVAYDLRLLEDRYNDDGYVR